MQQALSNNGSNGHGKVRPVPTRLLKMMAVRPGSHCLECGGSVERKDGDLVCVDCGLVYGVSYSDDRIPFGEYDGDGHFEGCYNPVNNSNYGKGLGTVIDTQLKAAVIAGPNGPGPLEFKKAQNLRIKLDEPLVMEFLKLANRFFRTHDLDSRHDEGQIRFRNQVGLTLRYLAEYYLKYKEMKHDSWLAVASTFTILLRDLYPERYKAQMGKSLELSVHADWINYYDKLLKTFSVPLLTSDPTRPQV